MIKNDVHDLQELGIAFSAADREMTAADAEGTSVERKKANEKWLLIIHQLIATPAISHQGIRIKAGVMLMVVRATKLAPGLMLDMVLRLANDVLSDFDQVRDTSRRNRWERKRTSGDGDLQ